MDGVDLMVVMLRIKIAVLMDTTKMDQTLTSANQLAQMCHRAVDMQLQVHHIDIRIFATFMETSHQPIFHLSGLCLRLTILFLPRQIVKKMSSASSAAVS